MEASYIQIDDIELKRIETAQNEKVIELIDNLEDGGSPIYEMDNLWDAMHFVLTGESAQNPLEENLLSQAIIGCDSFQFEDYMAVIPKEEIKAIADSLKAVTQEDIKKNFSLKKFKKHEIYPNFWESDNEDELYEEILFELERLTSFYIKAYENQKNILVSIY